MLTKYLSNRFVLPVAALIFLLLCYQLAFKKTWSAWQINRQFHREISSAQNLGTSPDLMVRKNKNLQRIIQQYRADSTAYRSAIIERVSQIATINHVLFNTVPQRESQLQAERIQIERLVLSGRFIELLKTLHELEQTPGIGLIRGVRFAIPKQYAGKPAAQIEMNVLLLAVKK